MARAGRQAQSDPAAGRPLIFRVGLGRALSPRSIGFGRKVAPAVKIETCARRANEMRPVGPNMISRGRAEWPVAGRAAGKEPVAEVEVSD